MSEATTYTSLLSDVQAYAERSDAAFVAQIPRLLVLAENRVAKDARLLGFVQYVTGTLAIGNPVMAKPSRWHRTISLSYLDATGQRHYLWPRSYEYCRTFWPDSSVRAAPTYYADYDYEHFFLAGTPDAAYAFELAYHELPQPLDGTNQTNWTTQYAPQLLLYATLLEAQPFLKNPDKLQLWQQLYQAELQALQGEDVQRMVDRATQRTQA